MTASPVHRFPARDGLPIRARITRELRDVVTYHVTAMVVQADAAQYLVPAAPDRATEKPRRHR
jgi:hypothetical protein